MLVCGSHSSVCKAEMLVCGSYSSVVVREKCRHVTNISLLQAQSYDYHIRTFQPYKHRAITTTYQQFSLTNTEL
jgi:hypothetical protein